MIHRLKALIIKEVLALLRDPRNRIILIVPPIAQLFVFSFAATLEVKNNSLAIWNEDGGPASVELVQRLAAMGAFSELHHIHDQSAFDRTIDRQEALLGIRIPQDFGRRLLDGSGTSLQIVVDGRRSSSGQIALGYVSEVVASLSDGTGHSIAPVSTGIVTRHWFNANLDYLWFVIPSLVALLTTLMTMIVTALSLARERELGTFDQLMVSPLTPGFILTGKAIPAFFVSMAEASVIVAVGVFIFGVPFEGSLLLLYVSMAVYIFSLVGIGLFISALCSTQQQAILGVFSFVLPAILLSGFAAPVDNMPQWLERATVLNPLRHFLEISKGLFLKDIPPQMVWDNAWPMLLIAVFSIAAADWLFRRKFA